MNNTKHSFNSFRYKIAAVFFALIIIYFANKDQNEVTKTKSQLNYEKWLTETEAKTRAAMNNEALPSLSLTIIPENEQQPALEEIINANNISDSKEKILRLLSLINEAGLYDYQTEKLVTKPGDIILKIYSPIKSFTLHFKPKNIETNIKAALLLRLYKEYAKDKIPENLAKNVTDPKIADLKESIFSVFEEQDKQK